MFECYGQGRGDNGVVLEIEWRNIMVEEIIMNRGGGCKGVQNEGEKNAGAVPVDSLFFPLLLIFVLSISYTQ